MKIKKALLLLALVIAGWFIARLSKVTRRRQIEL